MRHVSAMALEVEYSLRYFPNAQMLRAGFAPDAGLSLALLGYGTLLLGHGDFLLTKRMKLLTSIVHHPISGVNK